MPSGAAIQHTKHGKAARQGKAGPLHRHCASSTATTTTIKRQHAAQLLWEHTLTLVARHDAPAVCARNNQ